MSKSIQKRTELLQAKMAEDEMKNVTKLIKKGKHKNRSELIRSALNKEAQSLYGDKNKMEF